MNFFYIYFCLSSISLLFIEFFVNLCFTNIKLITYKKDDIIDNYRNNTINIGIKLLELIYFYIIIDIYYLLCINSNNIIYNFIKFFISSVISINFYNIVDTKDNSLFDFFIKKKKNKIISHLLLLYTPFLFLGVSPLFFKIYIVLSLLYINLKNNSYIIIYNDNNYIISDLIQNYVNYIMIIENRKIILEKINNYYEKIVNNTSSIYKVTNKTNSNNEINLNYENENDESENESENKSENNENINSDTNDDTNSDTNDEKFKNKLSESLKLHSD